MKIVKSLAFVLLLVGVVSYPAVAQESKNCDLSFDINQNPSVEQIKTALDQCKQKVNVEDAVDAVENATYYTNVGKQVAEAIGGAAREIGIAANEFLKSDAGTLTVLIILLGLFSNIIFGIPVWILANLFLIKLYRNVVGVKEYTTKTNIFGQEKKVAVYNTWLDLLSDRNDGSTVIPTMVIFANVCVNIAVIISILS